MVDLHTNTGATMRDDNNTTRLAETLHARGHTYTMDGEPVDIIDLGECNDFDPETLDEIETMQPGGTVDLGGGAGAEFLLARVS